MAISPQIFKNCQKKQKLPPKKPFYGKLRSPKNGCSWKFSPISRFIGKRSLKWPCPRKFCKIAKKIKKKNPFTEIYGTPKIASRWCKRKVHGANHEPYFSGRFFSFPEPGRPRFPLPSTCQKTVFWNRSDHPISKIARKPLLLKKHP